MGARVARAGFGVAPADRVDAPGWGSHRGTDSDFERTAKFGLEDNAGTWTHGQYQQRLDWIVFAELALGAYALGAAVLAIRLESWGIAAYSTLFGISVISVAVATIAQHIVLLRHLRSSAGAPSPNSVQLLDDPFEVEPTRFGRS